ncbi:MAG: RNA 2',3'-cyclic phosphodiesterase [Anaerovoracaceae bacterium]|jgi:2'-5' RNA ligase
MRLFIAINFDEKTKENLITVQNNLRKLGRGNFSRPENLHLTLAFLGEVSPERVTEICRVMDQLTVPVLNISFDHVSRFKRDGGDVWWIGLGENKNLIILQKELAERLRTAGFPIENRSFLPHVTLARKVKLEDKQENIKILKEPFNTVANKISLMLSHRIDGKLTYTEQYSVQSEM